MGARSTVMWEGGDRLEGLCLWAHFPAARLSRKRHLPERV